MIIILTILKSVLYWWNRLGCIEETNEPIEGSGDGTGGLLGDGDNPNPSGADGGIGGIDDGVTQEEMNLTCFNLMIDVLNSQMELQVCNSINLN